MPKKRYLVNLSDEERESLVEMTRKGIHSSRKLKRVQILLQADQGFSDPQIQAALHVSRPCVERLRQRFVEGGLEHAVNEAPHPGKKRKLDGRAEATLVATACTAAPQGHDHWTLRMLADKLVELEVVEDVSYETVRRTLKKMN